MCFLTSYRPRLPCSVCNSYVAALISNLDIVSTIPMNTAHWQILFHIIVATHEPTTDVSQWNVQLVLHYETINPQIFQMCSINHHVRWHHIFSSKGSSFKVNVKLLFHESMPELCNNTPSMEFSTESCSQVTHPYKATLKM